MKPTGYLKWDVDLVSTSLKLKKEETIEYFKDGRRASFLMERKIRDVINRKLDTNKQWTLAISEGSGYDLLDANNEKWEVRSLTKNVYFTPSNQVGSGRSFNKTGFLQKVNHIKGYFITDITKFPTIPYYKLTSDQIKKWWNEEELGKKASISRNKFYDLIEYL